MQNAVKWISQLCDISYEKVNRKKSFQYLTFTDTQLRSSLSSRARWRGDHVGLQYIRMGLLRRHDSSSQWHFLASFLGHCNDREGLWFRQDDLFVHLHKNNKTSAEIFMYKKALKFRYFYMPIASGKKRNNVSLQNPE